MTTATLTGVQPTGDLHLGNYIGAIRPLADLAADPSRDVYVFVADLHALDRRPDPAVLRERSRRLVVVPEDVVPVRGTNYGWVRERGEPAARRISAKRPVLVFQDNTRTGQVSWLGVVRRPQGRTLREDRPRRPHRLPTQP